MLKFDTDLGILSTYAKLDTLVSHVEIFKTFIKNQKKTYRAYTMLYYFSFSNLSNFSLGTKFVRILFLEFLFILKASFAGVFVFRTDRFCSCHVLACAFTFKFAIPMRR